MEIDVFVSYKHESIDEKFSIDLVNRLKESDIKNIWWDKDIQGAQNWENEISNALEAALLVVLVISPASMNSAYITYEWCYSHFGLNKPIYPIHLVKSGGADGVFGCFKNTQIQWENVENPPTEDNWSKLIHDIRRLAYVPDEVRDARRTLLDRHSGDKRIAAAETLGRYDTPASRKYLLEGLAEQMEPDRGNGELQRTIVQSLSEIGQKWDKLTIRQLWKLLELPPDDNVIRVTNAAIKKLTSQ